MIQGMVIPRICARISNGPRQCGAVAAQRNPRTDHPKAMTTVPLGRATIDGFVPERSSVLPLTSSGSQGPSSDEE